MQLVREIDFESCDGFSKERYLLCTYFYQSNVEYNVKLETKERKNEDSETAQRGEPHSFERLRVVSTSGF